MAGGGRARPRRVRSAGEARAGAVDADAASPSRRRRSERIASPSAQPVSQGKPSPVASKVPGGNLTSGPFPMRPVTVKKIMPRNRQIKETALIPRRSPRNSLKEDKENIPLRATEVENIPLRATEVESNAKVELKPSPLHSSLHPEAGALPVGTDLLPLVSADDEQELARAKRVRRSYSRLENPLSHSFLGRRQESPSSGLSDTSTPAHGPVKRQTLFGFDKLLVPGELASISPVNTAAPQMSAVAKPGVINERDTEIPGISFFKEKRRKKKMPQFDVSQLDEWAAQMNAEFEEAERFDLLVE
ncbi:sororin [Zootoca vivipara]|uniref:sororin n=1 Tax=Zootoca vivipara TaxID=8524 RepID=UPI00293B9BEE|nr:sororin [Zootoca vivipara]